MTCRPEGLDVADSTFSIPDLTTSARLDPLGLLVTGQFLEPDRAVRCGEHGGLRDSTTRRLAHDRFGWRPTILLVTVRRFRCAGCGHV